MKVNWKIAGVIFICSVSTVFAAERQTILNGSMSVENDYNSNVFYDHSNRTDEWNTMLAPVLTLSSVGQNDTVNVTYSPEFTYNHRRNEDELVQDLIFDATRTLSPYWTVGLTGNYSYFDNPTFESNAALTIERQFLRADPATQAEVVRLLFPELTWDPDVHMAYVISQIDQRYQDAPPNVQSDVDSLLVPIGGDDARQRYWESGIGFNSVYEFAENSTITLAYAYDQFDNRTEQRQSDNESHNPSIIIGYQFNQQWQAEVGYDFTRDYFDTSNNSQTDNPHFLVNYTVSPATALYWEYDYSKVKYDEGNNGSIDQSGTLGWDWTLDQRTNLNSSLGSTYLDRESAADEREVNLNTAISRAFNGGSWSLSGEGIYAENNDNSSWNKLRQSWELESSVSYQLLADLSSTVDMSYGEWQTWFADDKTTYDRLEMGAGVTYSFLQWFSLSVDYNFMLFETTSAGLDDFNEHTVTITLAAAKELWRW